MINRTRFISVSGKAIALDGKKFLSQQTKSDIIRIKELIEEVNSMGFFIEYIDQLRGMDKSDRCLIPVVIKYIGSFDNFKIEWTLFAALGERGFVEATDFLIKEFRKPNNEMIKLPDIAWNWTRRAVASSSLMNIRDTSRADEYIDLINNVDTHDDSIWFIKLLGDIKYEKAHALLVELLNDNSIDLQSSALESLGKYKNHPEVIPLIEPFIKSEHGALREHARKSITKLRKG
jgi:HEAT repeat protein